jgi:hypothetical protein
MKIRSISLPEKLDAKAAKAAEREDRTYSNWARRVIERAVAGASGERQAEPVVYADSEGPKQK